MYTASYKQGDSTHSTNPELYKVDRKTALEERYSIIKSNRQPQKFFQKEQSSMEIHLFLYLIQMTGISKTKYKSSE